ncbi:MULTISPECIES: HD domain-containing phosphohydrolase [Novipirellula]|uniref:Two-component system response regulator n=1 Tax=Novipirellula rosea TaxID=1031540 RepID=A0ABP8MAD9_9BACT
MKVLVVEDDAISREVVAHVLASAGYEVVTANDGCEAIQSIDTNGDCQLVISDRDMPGMDGIELCRALRARNTRGYIYFIMLTKLDQPNDKIKGLASGADDYISKPFNSAELLMRVNTGRRIIGLETRDMAIFMLAKLAESRDPDTGEHLERVRNFAKVLATRMRERQPRRQELDQLFIDLIYDTSPLHDIGKVAIPDSILLKPGKLTAAEFEIMKQHTIEGEKTLQAALDAYPNARFLQMARDIAVSHHEKFDGTGYPYALSGQKIPLSGRIVAVADVYDAVTSKRVYKEASSHEVARSLIIEGSGYHFDPEVVDAFLESDREFLAIKSRFAESPAERCSSLGTKAIGDPANSIALPANST